MGKPVVVKTKLLKPVELREFYELVAAIEVVSSNHRTCMQFVFFIFFYGYTMHKKKIV